MGFKRITKKDMETSLNLNLLGNPLKMSEKLEKEIEFEKNIKETFDQQQLRDAQIVNEEVIKYSYYNNGKLKKMEGYGNVTIHNVSRKDRIWDVNVVIKEGTKTNLMANNEIKIGNLEPEQNKIISYDIKKDSNIEAPLKIKELISVLNKNISEEKVNLSKTKKKNILIFGNKNTIEYQIILENISPYSLKKINFLKGFSRDFKNINARSDNSNIILKSNQVTCVINELRPKDKAIINITTDILPKKKEIIRTGDMEVKFSIEKNVLSETSVKNFSAYSHAMHSIHKKEKEKEPNHWDCNLFFKNNSDYNMIIKNIQVLDTNKQETYLESQNPVMIGPGGNHKTENWLVVNDKEPYFSRKLNYSIAYETKKSSLILITVDDNKFDIVDIELSKTFSTTELNSFEESMINNKIVIKNIGTIPINAISVKELIPQDFLLSQDLSNIKVRMSSGENIQNCLSLTITPPNEDPSIGHLAEISLNLENMVEDFQLKVNEFIEIKYDFKAITPDYSKKYDFPLEVNSYFSAVHYNVSPDDLIEAKYALQEYEQPSVKIIHRRRNIEIGKEIFPGRNVEEFGINILIKNRSEIESTDLNISDNIPTNCEIVSSNTEYNIQKQDKKNLQTLTFKIKSIQPYEEKEIRYYLKSISGKNINYAELESYIIS